MIWGPDAVGGEAVLLEPRHQRRDRPLRARISALVDRELLVVLIDRKVGEVHVCVVHVRLVRRAVLFGAEACEALLEEAQKQQQEDGGALDALDDFTRRMGALQSATDAQMSVLHRLVSV